MSSSAGAECEFCDELAGGWENAFRFRYGSEVMTRHIPSGQTFFLFPSLGQITEGHVLVIPRRHITSMVELTLVEIEELEELCERLKQILHEDYGECIFFEHGIRKADSGGCGIKHAHMHAVPVRGVGVIDVLTQSFQGCRINAIWDVHRAIAPDSSYLYFENCLGERYVFATPSMPSQYMRKVVCASLGKQNWDWREAGYESELVATLRCLAREFPASPRGLES